MNKTVSIADSDPRLGSFSQKMSTVVRAVAVAAPLLGLTMALYPQETLAKKAQVGGQSMNTNIIRGEINTDNCLGVLNGQTTPGAKVTVWGCLDNADQTNWVFHNGILINLARAAPQCVGVAGDRFREESQLRLGSCDSTAVRWELTGGKFKTTGNLCLDALNGVRSVAVLRVCAAELGSVRDPRRTDQYWDLSPTF
jgi:hypothetical protein